MMELQKCLRTPWEWWNAYWFSPAPSFNLAVCRIAVVGFQIFHLITDNFWGKLVEYSTLPNFLYDPLPVLQLLLLPFGSDYRPLFLFLASVFWLTLVAGVLGLLGLLTNLNLVIFAVGNIFIQAYLYSFRDFHHSEALVMIGLLILALSPTGRVLSLDDLRRRIQLNVKRQRFEAFDIKDENRTFARWPMLLLQWMFAIVYLDSAMSKFSKGGLDWMNGYTLQYYLWQDGLIWDRDFGVWFAQQHTLAMLAAWVAILFEATFFLVLIFPRLIWLYIPMGISFHTGIYIAQKAPFLKYIALYSVFIPWAAIAKTLSYRRKFSSLKHHRQPEVLYDGQDLQCIRLMTLLCYFDWLNRLRFSDLEGRSPSLSENHPEISLQDKRQNIHLLLPNGSMRNGFFAFRESLRYLPPLWPLFVISYLPYASTISAKIYGSPKQKRIGKLKP